MADRILALCGPGKGPRVYPNGDSILRVSGLPKDGSELVVVEINEIEDIVYGEDGDHKLPSGLKCINVRYEGDNRSLRAYLVNR